MNPDTSAMRVLAEQLRDPSLTDREVEIDGTTWYLRKAPRPGVRMTMAIGPAGTEPMLSLYEAAPSRPTDFPDDVPFVPGLPASVIVDPDTSTTSAVMWMEVPDAAELIGQLEAASLAEKWEIVERSDQFGGIAIELERDGERRMLMGGAILGQPVTLAQGTGDDRAREDRP